MLTDVPSGTVYGVDVDGERVAICNVDGEISAVSGTCTHADADLCDGDIEDGCLVCPLHYATFDARTGHRERWDTDDGSAGLVCTSRNGAASAAAPAAAVDRLHRASQARRLN